MCLRPLKMFYIFIAGNSHPIEVAGHGRETLLQVG